MRERSMPRVAAAAILSAVLWLAPASAGQTRSQTSGPRQPDGKPDLQGTYDLGTLTPMERAPGTSLTLDQDEARKLEEAVAIRNAQGNAPAAADRVAPPKGGERNAARRVAFTSDQRANEDDPGFEGPNAYNDPEQRPLGERCLVGFSSTSGPPVLPTYFYNNLHQIVQTPTRIMILTEMVHDARIVRMNEPHLPPGIRRWLGDSVGRWEGDTLVVDTTNFTDKTRFRGSSEQLHIVERFTRLDAKTLRYQFTVDDPTTWDRTWTGEYAWPSTDERIYEYACHEGNYALGNILRGARLKEKDEATKATKQQ